MFRSSLFKGLAEPPRSAVASAEANHSFRRVLFCQAFSLRLLPQRKKRIKTVEKHRIGRGTPHLCGSPNPSVALFKAGGISPSAEGDRRTRAGTRSLFAKSDAKTFKRFALNCSTNQNLKEKQTLKYERIKSNKTSVASRSENAAMASV